MTELRPAELLLQELGVTQPHEIDLEAIAYYQGAVVKYRRLEDCEARIIGSGDKAVISVDDRAIPSRRRFSVAHELGHWANHRGRSLICAPGDIGRHKAGAIERELVADRYAADLLLPRYIFSPLADDLRVVTYKNLNVLADTFGTSLTATAIRLVEHGPECAMLVCHDMHGRRWFSRPRHIPQRWFPNQELDADSYAFDVLYGKESCSKRSLMPADTWFSCRDASRYEIHEQSFSIGQGRVLTFLIFSDEEMLAD